MQAEREMVDRSQPFQTGKCILKELKFEEILNAEGWNGGRNEIIAQASRTRH